MSKLIVPTPTECACCHERDGCEATITLNSQYLYRLGLPKGWVAKATLHVLDDGFWLPVDFVRLRGLQCERTQSMSDIRDEARALEALEMLIDSDYPPGMAAHDLARAVVNLVRDQGGIDALRITIEVDRIATGLGRPRGT